MGRARAIAIATTTLTLLGACASDQPDAFSRDRSCGVLAADLHQYGQIDETADRSTLIRKLDVLAYETYDQDLAAATRHYADLMLRHSHGEDVRGDLDSVTERLHELCPTQISRPSPVAHRRRARLATREGRVRSNLFVYSDQSEMENPHLGRPRHRPPMPQ